MKTLNELGISPAPWQWDEGMSDDMVISSQGTIAEWMDAKDARLVSAAPDLYEALREVYERICAIQAEHDLSHADDEDTCEECYNTVVWIYKARAALEKAGGKE